MIKGWETCHIKSVLILCVNPSIYSLHQALPCIICRWSQYVWEIKYSETVTAEVVLGEGDVLGLWKQAGLKLKWGCESQSCRLLGMGDTLELTG